MIFHIKKKVFLIATFLMSLSQPAFSGEGQDTIKTCRAALENSIDDIIEDDDEINFRFKSISGVVLKKLEFSTKIDGKKVLFVCHIKRKKVRKLNYKTGKVIAVKDH